MNVTLESMARAVFRQWFVENEESENWEVGRLGDVAKNIRRGANPSEINPDTHYIGLEHMPRKSIGLAEWGNASELESNKFAFKAGEFLFGKLRPYFHKVGIAPVDGVCSTDILVIAPKSPEWYGFVLGHISSTELINYTDSASTGTKMPRTNWSDIAKYEVVLPPVSLVQKYNEIFLPIAEKIRANILESRTLASLRDSLLPRLMRGEVRVKDVEV
jgi:type I restriction enzyme S subunit